MGSKGVLGFGDPVIARWEDEHLTGFVRIFRGTGVNGGQCYIVQLSGVGDVPAVLLNSRWYVPYGVTDERDLDPNAAECWLIDSWVDIDGNVKTLDVRLARHF